MASRAVHLTTDDVADGEGPTGNGVPHLVFLLAHVADGLPGEQPGVMGLATAGRVEGGPVQRDAISIDCGAPVFTARGDGHV